MIAPTLGACSALRVGGLFCSFLIEQTFVFLWCGFSPFPLGNKRSKMRPKEEKGGFGRRES